MAFKLKDEHVCSLNSNVQVIGMRDKQDKGGKKFKALFGFAKRGNTSVEVEFRYPKMSGQQRSPERIVNDIMALSR